MMAHIILFALCATTMCAEENSGLNPRWVSCFDSTGRFVGSKDVRTEVLVSPNGKLRAYAEVSATAKAESDCENTVRLFVSPDNRPYRMVFEQGPSVMTGTANSLGPVAWSPNSRWLAVEFGYWFYASDNLSQGLLLYDSRTRAITRPDVIGRIEAGIRKDCSLYLRSIVGFDSRGRVVMRVADLPDEEGHSSSCIQGTAEWLYDPVTGRTMPCKDQR